MSDNASCKHRRSLSPPVRRKHSTAAIEAQNLSHIGHMMSRWVDESTTVQHPVHAELETLWQLWHTSAPCSEFPAPLRRNKVHTSCTAALPMLKALALRLSPVDDQQFLLGDHLVKVVPCIQNTEPIKSNSLLKLVQCKAHKWMQKHAVSSVSFLPGYPYQLAHSAVTNHITIGAWTRPTIRWFDRSQEWAEPWHHDRCSARASSKFFARSPKLWGLPRQSAKGIRWSGHTMLFHLTVFENLTWNLYDLICDMSNTFVICVWSLSTTILASRLGL